MKMFQSRMTKSYSFKNSIRDFKKNILAIMVPLRLASTCLLGMGVHFAQLMTAYLETTEM